MSEQGENGSLIDNLDSFIDTAREVVEVAPPDDPDRIIWLHDLGNTLRRHFSITGVLADIEDSIKVGQEAIDTAPNDYIHRGALLDSLGVHLSFRFARIGSLSDLERAIQVTRRGINVAVDLSHVSRHHRVCTVR